MTDSNDAIAWLSLRDGHLVPIADLSPDGLKRSAKGCARRDGHELGHVTALNATLHRLGLKGDFAEYQSDGWPALQRFMAAKDLRAHRNLFTGWMPYGGFRSKRRALADRLTLRAGPIPRRVFLALDYDWDEWERDVAADPGHLHGRNWRSEDEHFLSTDVRETRGWVHRHRLLTLGADNFIGDQLFEPLTGPIVVRLYFHRGYTPAADEQQHNLERVIRAMMNVVAREERGWVTIHPYNENLIFLRAHDGSYDVLWRNTRNGPSTERGAFRDWLADRSDVWLEKWEHEAELRYYAEGGSGVGFPGHDALLEHHLRALGTYTPVEETGSSTEGSR